MTPGWRQQKDVGLSCSTYYVQVDESLPPPMRYSRVRIPGEGVRICTDKSFLSCCDCKDDCIDRSKCACIRLTVESTIGTDEAVMDEEAGYKHKR